MKESIRFTPEQFENLVNNPERVFGEQARLLGIAQAYHELEHQILLYISDLAEDENSEEEVSPELQAVDPELQEVSARLEEAAVNAALVALETGDKEPLRDLWDVGLRGSESYFIKDSRRDTKPRKEFLEWSAALERGEDEASGDALMRWYEAEQANRNGPCTIEVHRKGKVIAKVSYEKRNIVLPPSDPNDGQVITP